MADSTVAALTEATTLGGDELFYAVDDPSGTPANVKVLASTIRSVLDLGASGTADLGTVGTITSGVADGASAVFYSLLADNTATTAGCRLLELGDATIGDKLAVEKAGELTLGGAFQTSTTSDISGTPELQIYDPSAAPQIAITSDLTPGNWQASGSLDFYSYRSTGTTMRRRGSIRGYQADNTNTGALRLGGTSVGTVTETLQVTHSGVAVGDLSGNTQPGAELDVRGTLLLSTGVTVSGLPGTPVVGMMARVTDADTPAVGSTVTGGGAAAALVWYNGSAWTVIGI